MSSSLPINAQPQLKVLVAEDNRINQKILKELLRKEGLDATIVNNGNEVLTKLNEQNFDLLILDFHMPELNGLDTLKAIRNHSDDHINSIRVVLFTAEQDRRHIQDIQAYGIDYLLQKPINQIEFSNALKKVNNSFVVSSSSKASSSMNYLLDISGGNKKLMIELMDIFITEIPENIQKIKKFNQESDWPAVQKLAHKLGSNFKYVGASEAEEILKALETDFEHDQNKQKNSSQIQRLEELAFQIVKTLQEEKQKLQLG